MSSTLMPIYGEPGIHASLSPLTQSQIPFSYALEHDNDAGELPLQRRLHYNNDDAISVAVRKL